MRLGCRNGLKEYDKKIYVCHGAPGVARSSECVTAELMREAPRNRLTGVGFKPPLAAVVKSHGRERVRKARQ